MRSDHRTPAPRPASPPAPRPVSAPSRSRPPSPRAARWLAAGLALLVALAPTTAAAALGASPTPAAPSLPGAPAEPTRPAQGSPAPVGRDYVLPVPGAMVAPTRAALIAQIVLREFVSPASAWGAGHRGVDLAAPEASTVLAPAAGTVTFVGVVVDRPLMVITHPDGLRSTLEPVVSHHDLGTRVAAGAVVGTLAEVPTHCAPARCLHWGVRSGEEYLDPLLLLGLVQAVVLLPRD